MERRTSDGEQNTRKHERRDGESGEETKRRRKKNKRMEKKIDGNKER